jgi:RHS repeat-associated protein
MKLTNLICAFVLAATATMFATEAGPKKMNGKLEIVEANPGDVFYTGKPYEEDLGGYVFNYRTYSPDINRWTTPDPSGFPDGANNCVYGSNTVPSTVDPTGLTDKSVVWIYAYAWVGSERDQQCEDAFRAAYQNCYDKLTQADASVKPPPHYLDDGDEFAYSTIASISQLKSFDMYDRICLGVHGIVEEKDIFVIGTVPYHVDDIYGTGSNVYSVAGCTNGRKLEVREAASQLFYGGGNPYKEGTAKYLKE